MFLFVVLLVFASHAYADNVCHLSVEAVQPSELPYVITNVTMSSNATSDKQFYLFFVLNIDNVLSDCSGNVGIQNFTSTQNGGVTYYTGYVKISNILSPLKEWTLIAYELYIKDTGSQNSFTIGGVHHNAVEGLWAVIPTPGHAGTPASDINKLGSQAMPLSLTCVLGEPDPHFSYRNVYERLDV